MRAVDEEEHVRRAAEDEEVGRGTDKQLVALDDRGKGGSGGEKISEGFGVVLWRGRRRRRRG